MRWSNNCSMKVSVLLIIGSLIFSLIYANYWSDYFWRASLVNIITIFVAGFVTYYLKEQKDDSVRRNACIESIVGEIENMVLSTEIMSDSRPKALSKQTACSSRIKYLKDANIKGIQEDIDFIDQHFWQLRDLYSPNETIMEKNLPMIQKQQDLIAARCVKIRISLFCRE